MKTTTKYSPEVREQAVRVVLKHQDDHELEWAAICSISARSVVPLKHCAVGCAEVIHRRSWQNREAVELTTLEWMDWFNHRRLLEPIGNRPPAEAEAIYYQQLSESAQAA